MKRKKGGSQGYAFLARHPAVRATLAGALYVVVLVLDGRRLTRVIKSTPDGWPTGAVLWGLAAGGAALLYLYWVFFAFPPSLLSGPRGPRWLAYAPTAVILAVFAFAHPRHHFTSEAALDATWFGQFALTSSVVALAALGVLVPLRIRRVRSGTPSPRVP